MRSNAKGFVASPRILWNQRQGIRVPQEKKIAIIKALRAITGLGLKAWLQRQLSKALRRPTSEVPGRQGLG